MVKLEFGGLPEAESILNGLGRVFVDHSPDATPPAIRDGGELPNLEAKYRTLVEQLPAVVFLVYLDRGKSEAYVSPQIEQMLGYSREEWIEDPIRWYERIHPDDRLRWSTEAAGMILSGAPLRSVYRVIASDGGVVSFQCDAKMVRSEDGRPWFIHGVAFDVSDLKRAESALQEERNFVAAVLDTVASLVAVLDSRGRIVRFNRACEEASGYSFDEVSGRFFFEMFAIPEERARFQAVFTALIQGGKPAPFEGTWDSRDGVRRLLAWSNTVLLDARGKVEFVITTGIDLTESKRLEKAILDISAREQRRIGQDLHDGLGQHLTGVAFLSKSLQQSLSERSEPQAEQAARIVQLVNEAIHKTRELSRGLLPVVSAPEGLLRSLELLASEIEDLFGVTCQVQCKGPIPIPDTFVATHLYHIAQEALNNAIKHGRARNITVVLSTCGEQTLLTVEDDGSGIPQPVPGAGMGLRIMNYRAKMIGGSVKIESGAGGGTRVICSCFAEPGPIGSAP